MKQQLEFMIVYWAHPLYPNKLPGSFVWYEKGPLHIRKAGAEERDGSVPDLYIHHLNSPKTTQLKYMLNYDILEGLYSNASDYIVIFTFQFIFFFPCILAVLCTKGLIF